MVSCTAEHSKNRDPAKLVLFTFFKGMSPTSSPIKETKAKASYTVKFEMSVDLSHDSTRGRSIENVVEDIGDFILDNDEFWDSFPFVMGASVDCVAIKQNSNNIEPAK